LGHEPGFKFFSPCGVVVLLEKLSRCIRHEKEEE
jgi:hypothetical protein